MKASAEKHPCGMCGKPVARLNVTGAPLGKRTVRHKCPHGTWCKRGHPIAYGDNNPGCCDCRTPTPGDGRSETEPRDFQREAEERLRHLVLVATNYDVIPPADFATLQRLVALGLRLEAAEEKFARHGPPQHCAEEASAWASGYNAALAALREPLTGRKG
jgi:hypothetical protein